MAYEAALRGIVESVSASTIRRWLADDALKPWQYRSWISIRDPNFRAKATRVLDLYQRVWDGQPLGPGEYVISSDEKPSIQARCRCHPTLAPGKGRAMRVEHAYDRGGALTYLAAYDVHRAALHGRCAASTGIEPFMALVEQVMSQEPYKSAKRVFWIVDNGSSHRGQKATNRLTKRFTNAVMVHTPIHASWLNQVESYFSVIQRKLLTPNTFRTSAPCPRCIVVALGCLAAPGSLERPGTGEWAANSARGSRRRWGRRRAAGRRGTPRPRSCGCATAAPAWRPGRAGRGSET